MQPRSPYRYDLTATSVSALRPWSYRTLTRSDGCSAANVDGWLFRTMVVFGVVSIVIGSPSSGAMVTAFPLIALIIPSIEA